MESDITPDINQSERVASILVVDDDPSIVRLLTLLLEKDGYHVRSTDNGSDALHMIIQECPDVIMTDWMMPGIDGLELCRRVRRLHQRSVLPHYVHLLMLTAQTGRDQFVEALDAGADDFIRKGATDLADMKIEIRARLCAGLRPRRLERELERAAKYDALTQLFNRATFFEQAAFAWERSTRNKFPISCVMMDCDYFKRINDVHGHKAGDEVLRSLSKTLRMHTRPHDITSRFGGEEFCLLLPQCRERMAWKLAERIRLYIEATPIIYEEVTISVTASFGVVERAGEESTLDQLLEQSDQLLRFAKESGRNCCIGTADAAAQTQGSGKHGITGVLGEALVCDVMIPLPFKIAQNDTIAAVVEKMLQHHIEIIPVLNEEEKFAGSLSMTQILTLVGVLPKWETPVMQHTSPNAISYQADAPVRVLFDFFSRASFPLALVLDGEKPVGYVNSPHLLGWLRARWGEQLGSAEQLLPK